MLAPLDTLRWLQHWYESQCDEDWEHSFRISITTLDNPGWRVAIDLTGTPLEERPFNKIEWHRSDQEWLVCRLEGAQFVGYSGAHQLVDAIEAFRAWAGELASDTLKA